MTDLNVQLIRILIYHTDEPSQFTGFDYMNSGVHKVVIEPVLQPSTFTGRWASTQPCCSWKGS